MSYCSLVFDDGYQETFDNVLPILKENGIRATFAVAMEPESIEKSENISCAREQTWGEAIKQGHEIASHTISHRALTTLKQDELDLELRAPAKNLNAASLIYPGGAYNQQIKQVARKYYLCARTAQNGLNELPISDWFGLKTLMVTKAKNPYQKLKQIKLLKNYIKKALENGSWLIISYHLISDKNKSYRFTTTVKEFKKHIKWIMGAGLKIITLKEAKRIS